MQRSVLLGACAAVVVVAGGIALRNATRHEAARVLDRGLDQMLASLPPGYEVRHGATDYNPLTGSATVHELVVREPDGFTWTADSLMVSGADERALQDVFDPRAYPNGHPAWTERRALIGNVVASHVRGVRAVPRNSDFIFDRLTLASLSGRPFALPPTPENRATNAFAADAALAFALDSATARGVALSTDGETPTSVAFASLDISRYDGGRLRSADAQAFSLKAANAGKAPVSVTVDSMDIRDADARAPLRAIQRDRGAGSAALAMVTYSATDLAGLSVRVPGGVSVSMHDFHATQSGADAAGARTWQVSQAGLTVSPGETKLSPQAAAGLAAFGMTTLTMDMDVASHSSPPLRTAEFTEDFRFHDLGTLHIQASASGYDPAAARPDSPTAALMTTTIERGSLVWQDHSLIDRMLKVAAAQMHSTPDVVRAQLAMPIVTLSVMVPDQPDAADQVTAFLNHPGKLTITVAPPQPVTIGQVAQAPATQRAHLLGLHIQAN